MKGLKMIVLALTIIIMGAIELTSSQATDDVIECEDGCGEKFDFIDKAAHSKRCKALLDPEGF